MKQYVIDELRIGEFEKIKSYLDEKFDGSDVKGIYWILIPSEMLNEIQAEHAECQPFYFAVDIEPKQVSCEFLIRTQKRIRCDCIGYASEKQRNWLISFIDSMFDELGIIT